MNVLPQRTRRAPLAVAAVTAALVLAGCGAGSEPDQAATAATSAGGATGSTATDAGTGAEAGAERGGSGSAVPAPMQFTAAAVDGSSVDGAALAAKPTVAWFWAPWCSICRSEAPDVSAAAEKFAEQVNFVGIAGLGPVKDMKRFVAETGVTGFPHAVDADGSLWSGFGVAGQPAFAFVHPDGDVEVVPASLSAADLEQRIQGLLDA